MSVKVKICGATMPEQARAIAALGADYIGGIIEFPKSPRSVTRETAREIREAVEAGGAQTVGVVVSLSVHQLVSLIEETGIRIWQLHGDESVEYVKRLKEYGVEVWKAVCDNTPHPDICRGTPLKRGFNSYGGVAEGQGGFDIRSV